MFGSALEYFCIKACGLSDSGISCFLANSACLPNLHGTSKVEQKRKQVESRSQRFSKRTCRLQDNMLSSAHFHFKMGLMVIAHTNCP